MQAEEENALSSMLVTDERVGEVLVVTAAGVMPVRAVDEMARYVEAALSLQDARAVVIDVRNVILAVAPEAWRTRALPSAGQDVPACYVVSPACIGLIRQRCAALAARGSVRSYRTDLAAAIAWAAQRREHWPHLPAVPVATAADRAPPHRRRARRLTAPTA